jgi:hypothetical protein
MGDNPLIIPLAKLGALYSPQTEASEGRLVKPLIDGAVAKVCC